MQETSDALRSLPAAANIDRFRSDAVAFGKGLMVRRFLTLLSLTVCATLGLPMAPAAAQQNGGILKFFHRQPGEHVDPRGSDNLDGCTDDGRFQQSRTL